MIRDFERQDLFPTLVYSATVETAGSLNEAVLEAIEREQDADPDGVTRSNHRRLGGWHSRDTLHKDAEFAMLARLVRDMADRLGQDLGYHSDSRLALIAMWAIINGPGAANRSHLHPGSLWSGVYYVRTSDGSGDITFTDPRTANLMRMPRYADRPAVCRGAVTITPEPGLLLMFPSWLYHEVHPNLSDEARVIVSFNLA